MFKKLEKVIAPSLIIIFILGLAIGGYWFINVQTKKQLAKLEEEMRPVASPKPFPSTEPRALTLTDQPEVEKNATFYIKTASGQTSFVSGQSFNLQVFATANGEVVDGVEFLLNYNPEMIEIGQPVIGYFFSLYPQQQVDDEEGTVRVMAVQNVGASKALYDELVVTLPVTALKKGTVNFDFTEEKSHIAAYGGQDLLDKAITFEVTIE